MKKIIGLSIFVIIAAILYLVRRNKEPFISCYEYQESIGWAASGECECNNMECPYNVNRKEVEE